MLCRAHNTYAVRRARHAYTALLRTPYLTARPLRSTASDSLAIGIGTRDSRPTMIKYGVARFSRMESMLNGLFLFLFSIYCNNLLIAFLQCLGHDFAICFQDVLTRIQPDYFQPPGAHSLAAHLDSFYTASTNTASTRSTLAVTLPVSPKSSISGALSTIGP